MDDSLQPTIDMLLNVSIFMWFGAVCPWHQFVSNNVIPIYRLIPLGILVLLLRRLPMVLAFHKKIPQIEEVKHAAFVGFFGPIGVSAIFYLYVSREFLRDIEVDGQQREDAAHLAEVLNVVIWFLAVCSITVHGLSIPLGKLGLYLPRTISTALSSERVSASQSMARASDPDEPHVPHWGQQAVKGERSLMRQFRRWTSTSDGGSSSPSSSTSWVPKSIAKIGRHILDDLRKPESKTVPEKKDGMRGASGRSEDQSSVSSGSDDHGGTRPEISGPRDARLIGHAINNPPVTVNADGDRAARAVEEGDGPRVKVHSPPQSVGGSRVQSPAQSGTATPVGGNAAMGWQRSIRFGDETAPPPPTSQMDGSLASAGSGRQ